jgi:hypothetical protein
MPEFTLKVLGPPQVETADGSPVKRLSPSSAALLAYFSLQPRPVARDPSVQGNWVAYHRGWGDGAEEGDQDLFLLDLATRTERRLTENDWNDTGPELPHDGRMICWTSKKEGHWEAEIMAMISKPVTAGMSRTCRAGRTIANGIRRRRWCFSRYGAPGRKRFTGLVGAPGVLPSTFLATSNATTLRW